MSNTPETDSAAWGFVFSCATLGLLTLLYGLVRGLLWLCNHVTITP